MLGKCREYSIPLIGGVIFSLIWANLYPESYYYFIHNNFYKQVNFHLLIDDVFMVFFFAIAGVEIVNSLCPGGALNPIGKAVTPLMATAGGVFGAVGVFFLLNTLIGSPDYSNGWGVCTATDIALAWLVAKVVFGKNHPAVSFLLLLAVADDGIGLAIIAIFYPNPLQPTEPIWLAMVVAAMLMAGFFNKIGIKNYWPYVLICGAISWLGMYNAHLHPALALIFVMPFLPRRGVGAPQKTIRGLDSARKHSTLEKFEHQVSPVVDVGLFFFGLTNAGVEISKVSALTLIIFLSLVVGKTIGVSLFTFIAACMGFKLPRGMRARDVMVAGIVAGMGLTVALFVSDSAFVDLSLQGAAKMGALFTALSSIFAILTGQMVGVKKVR